MPSWLSHRFLRCKRREPESLPKNHPSLGCITRLPVDILLSIADHLACTDVVSLSLSCKAIHVSLGKQKSLVLKTVEDRVSFLQRIEDQFPKHLLCHQCGVFHTRRWVHSNAFSKSTCATLNGAVYLEEDKFVVPFDLVQEVMSLHRYGRDTHALWPLLKHKAKRQLHCACYKCIFSGKIRINPKIVNSELILSAKFSGYFSTELVTPARAAAWLVQNFCYHQEVLPNIAPLDCRVGGKYYLRCTYCRTEAALHFATTPCYCQMKAVIQVYRNLGDGRDPFHQWAENINQPRNPSLMETISFHDLTYSNGDKVF